MHFLKETNARPCPGLLRAVMAGLFVVAGVLHFLYPDPYVAIMPRALPYPRELVYLSGLCEILGGLGVIIPGTRRAAGIGLILLLIAVFPANVQMAADQVQKDGFTLLSALLILRLPLQLVFIRWVDRCTRRPAAAKTP